MNGKKTYLIVVAALIYAGGAKLGFWALDPTIITGIGALAAATLRHAITPPAAG